MKPPRCLNGLVARAAEDPGVDLDTNVEEGRENRFFAISCDCGGSTFIVRSYLGLHWYLQTMVAYGTVWLRCTTCGRERETFNPAIHGYDAETDHFPPKDVYGHATQEYPCPTCTATTGFGLTARFEYPDDILESPGGVLSPSELVQNPDSELNRNVEDLFTFITLIGQCGSCGTLSTVLTRECA